MVIIISSPKPIIVSRASETHCGPAKIDFGWPDWPAREKVKHDPLMCMHIIGVRCFFTSIAYCSRAFLFFPSFTLSPSSLSPLPFPLTFFPSCPLPYLSSFPFYPSFFSYPSIPSNLSISSYLLFPNSSLSFLSIPPFLGRLLPIKPLISFQFLH